MKTSDITIVFQGAFKPYVTEGKESFVQNVRTIRRVLPGAKIIISTWKGTEIPPGISSKNILFLDDPGPLAPLKLTDAKVNNVNRQLVSTQAGLAAVTTPYAVKLRTDCYLEHAGFLDYFTAQRKRDGGRERIVTTSFFTLDPTVFERIPYHLSDWFQFGPTELLRSYWSAPPMSAEDARFYECHPHAEHSTFFERKFRSRFAVEQYICMHYSALRGYACPRFLNDVSNDVMKDYYRFLANEIMVLDPWQAGLVCQKYSWVGGSLFQRLNNLMHIDWLRISGQTDFNDMHLSQVERLFRKRERQKRMARSGFQFTRPVHSYMFDPSGKGNALRMVAYRVLKHLT